MKEGTDAVDWSNGMRTWFPDRPGGQLEKKARRVGCFWLDSWLDSSAGVFFFVESCGLISLLSSPSDVLDVSEELDGLVYSLSDVSEGSAGGDISMDASNHVS